MMIEDLGVGCGTIRVRYNKVITQPTTPTIPPIVVAVGAVSILGLLAFATTGSSIPITTGKLGGRIVGVKLRK